MNLHRLVWSLAAATALMACDRMTPSQPGFSCPPCDAARGLARWAQGQGQGPAPEDWRPLPRSSTAEASIDWLYGHAASGNVASKCALASVSCVTRTLAEADREAVIAKCSGQPDCNATVVCAGQEVQRILALEKGNVCRHHAMALMEVLGKLDVSPSLGCSTTHAWIETECDGYRVLADAYNDIYVQVGGPEISELEPSPVTSERGTIRFENEGTAPLEWWIASLPEGATIVGPDRGKVEAGKRGQIVVSMPCGDSCPTGVLAVGSNDADENPKRVAIRPDCGCTDEASTSGDPHLITLDGLKYDLQSHGELVLIEGGSDLMVQVRQARWGQRNVAVNRALATRIGRTRVGIYAGQDPPLRIDGKPAEVDGERAVRGGGRIRRDSKRYTLTWPGGERMIVDTWQGFLDVRLTLPRARRGKVRGLLGNFDGEPTNDLATRDGKPLAQRPSFADLHDTYADSWRIRQDESLFDYGPGESTATFTDLDFPGEAATTAGLTAGARASAEATCRRWGVTDPAVLDACVLDVALTADESFAVAAAQIRPPRASLAPTIPPELAAHLDGLEFCTVSMGTACGRTTYDPTRAAIDITWAGGNHSILFVVSYDGHSIELAAPPRRSGKVDRYLGTRTGDSFSGDIDRDPDGRYIPPNGSWTARPHR